MPILCWMGPFSLGTEQSTPILGANDLNKRQQPISAKLSCPNKDHDKKDLGGQVRGEQHLNKINYHNRKSPNKKDSGRQNPNILPEFITPISGGHLPSNILLLHVSL